ncbi:hypothetical protein [Microbacterium xanthum]|uniref:hypothetical protein n=1 Tax=Microbacterium xanthum TaxID=3079794 RepID=UPI002AD3DCCF|nr:hypothetical protein [Microbacterium sp. KSW-48]MDZ8171382.1 hypothetical protein [Microbacterium sp. KSW-48]
MNREDLLRIVEDEGLDTPIFDRSRDPEMDSVVIRQQDGAWSVFVSDERGYAFERTYREFASQPEALAYALAKLRQVQKSSRSHAAAGTAAQTRRAPEDTADDPRAALLRTLVDNLRGVGADWSSLAIVVNLRGSRVSGTSGFAYLPDGGVEATAARPSAIAPAVAEYLRMRYPGDAALPVAILVQLDRPTGRYEITFEDADTTRWTATPATIDDVREQLRPRLGDTAR